MAQFGACHPVFKADTAQAGVIVGKLVAANLTINTASGELYADDGLAEQVSEFASGSLALETDRLEDDVAVALYGCTKATGNDGEVTYNKDDTPPIGKFGYFKTLMRDGVKYYRAVLLLKCRAALGNDNAQTRGNNITFSTEQTTITVMALDNGDWRKTKTCSTKEAAITWLNTQCSISASTGGGGTT